MNIKLILRTLYKPGDIRFWIILFFIIRLFGITNPPLEVAHNWRQTTVTMVARNFYEIDSNILFPRIDIAGEKTGITGMEFPIFNYLIYLISLVFGYQHWYGRLLNLIVSSFGIYFFSLLVKKYFSSKTSLYSSIILIVSVWFIFSRKIMPDTFSMSLIFMGFYYGTNYFEKRSGLKHLLLYFFLTTLGMLAKLPCGYILILFVPIIVQQRKNYSKIIIFSVVSLISILITGIWYFYWVPNLVETYGFWHFFMGKDMGIAIQEILEYWNLTLSRFYGTAIQYTGFVTFAGGLIYAAFKRNIKILLVFGLSFAAFLIIILKAGFTFSHHSYYIIPFAPIMALLAGYALAEIKNQNWAISILAIICLEGVLNAQHDFRIKTNEAALIQLENDLDHLSNRNKLILINSGSYPTPMYFAHRKGWIVENSTILDGDYIDSLSNLGLKHIVILKKTFGSNIALPYKKEFDNSDYTIYTP
jgi:4-amino-4-deoxy-L-arabinose transferase-like glycosyltransferase